MASPIAVVDGTAKGPPIRSQRNGANAIRVRTSKTEESQDDQKKMHLSDGSKSRMVVPVPDRCAKNRMNCFAAGLGLNAPHWFRGKVTARTAFDPASHPYRSKVP